MRRMLMALSGAVLLAGCGGVDTSGTSSSSTTAGVTVTGHTVSEHGVMHRPGLTNPQVNCVECHGASLQGGDGPSCTSCHSKKW